MNIKRAKYEKFVDFKLMRTWLKECRESKNLSQKDLGDLTGYSASHIQRIENGEAQLSITEVFRIFDATGYDIVIRRRPIAATPTRKAKPAKQAQLVWEEIAKR